MEARPPLLRVPWLHTVRSISGSLSPLMLAQMENVVNTFQIRNFLILMLNEHIKVCSRFVLHVLTRPRPTPDLTTLSLWLHLCPLWPSTGFAIMVSSA